MDEIGNDLAKINPQDIVPAKTRLSSCEPMDLTIARRVLETVVSTPENTFTEGSDLGRVGPYDIAQVREAFRLVSQDIMQSSGVSRFGRDNAEKQTPSGNLSLTVRKHLYRQKGWLGKRENLGVLEEPLTDDDDDPDWDYLEKEGVKAGAPISLAMSLTAKNGDRVLLFELPLEDDLPAGKASGVGFYDYREGGRMVSMYNFMFPYEGFSKIDGYRHMWRGLRWLSDNILNWKGDFKLPEDLDKPLPPGSNPKLLK